MAKSSSKFKGISKSVQLGEFVFGQRTLSAVASSYANDATQMSIQLWSSDGPYGRLTTFASDPLQRPQHWQVAVKIADENEEFATAALASSMFLSHRAVDGYMAIASLNLDFLPAESVGQIADELGWKISLPQLVRILGNAAKVVGLPLDLRDGAKSLDPFNLPHDYQATNLALLINDQDVLLGYGTQSTGEIIQDALKLLSEIPSKEMFAVQRG